MKMICSYKKGLDSEYCSNTNNICTFKDLIQLDWYKGKKGYKGSNCSCQDKVVVKHHP